MTDEDRLLQSDECLELPIGPTFERCEGVLAHADQGVQNCAAAVERATESFDSRSMASPRDHRLLGEAEYNLRAAIDRRDHAAFVVHFVAEAVDLRALLTRVRALAHKQVTSGDAYERINEIREALDLPTGWTRR